MPTSHISKNIMPWVWLVLLIVPLGTLQADDTDLFDVSSQPVPTRIMLVVDSSGSMAAPEGNTTAPPYYDGDCTGEYTYLVEPRREPSYSVTIQNADRKICIVKEVLLSFLDPAVGEAEMLWPDNFNVGLAKYGEPGAIVSHPIAALGSINDPASNRNALISEIRGMVVEGYTPLVGSYLEVAEYLTGGQAVSRASSQSDSSVWLNGNSGDYRYAGVDLGPQCGITNNHLVFLTDGESKCEKGSAFTQFERDNIGCTDEASNLVIGDLGTRVNEFVTGDIGEYNDACSASFYSQYELVGLSYESYWGCLSLMSGALAANQQTVNGVQESAVVNTHIIAYDMSGASVDTVSGMASWAAAGGGKFISAGDKEELTKAFREINNDVVLPGTFVVASGGVGVNQLNRFTHLDELYFSMFTPSSKPFWYGNLKKYYFQAERSGELGIYTNSGKTTDAIEDGVFVSGVLSEWSDVVPAYYNTSSIVSVDGDIAHIGGAASQIEQPSGRKLFVYYDDVQYQLVPDDPANTQQPIDALRSVLLSDYSGLLADAGADAGLSTVYETETLVPSLDWLLGVDVNDEWLRISQHVDPDQRPENPVDERASDYNDLRNVYGAPLHSSPVLVNYESRDANGEPLSTLENVVFISTNDGKLYALDSETGEEHLAYMPEAMLKRQAFDTPSPVESMYAATKPAAADGNLIYGLDSTWTVWRQDVDRNGNIDENSQDFVFLYGGMRRGGRNYYILDATNVHDSETIEEKAVIEGGVNEFVNNGQSWSEPKLAIINYAGTLAGVFIIGGGYDPVYDSGRPETLPAKGAQIYIIAAQDFQVAQTGDIYQAGDVLWWASSLPAQNEDAPYTQVAALQYSIPSTVKTVDLNGDELLDFFYVGDMGGQIHRFDVNNANSGASDLISNPNDTVVAQLGVAGASNVTQEIDRRFFYPPSVAKMQCPQGYCMALAIGSGWRSNPLDASVEEKFFYLMDYEPFTSNQPVITEEATTADGELSLLQPVTKIENEEAITAASTDIRVRGYSLELGGSGSSAEKLLGSPLIVGGQVVFSTYYRPDVAPSVDSCQIGEGASAIYSFTPGDGQVLSVQQGLSQNVAGSIQVLVSELAEQNIDNDGDGEPDQTIPASTGGAILAGTRSGGSPPLRLDVIRKTRWKQLE